MAHIIFGLFAEFLAVVHDIDAIDLVRLGLELLMSLAEVLDEFLEGFRGLIMSVGIRGAEEGSLVEVLITGSPRQVSWA